MATPEPMLDVSGLEVRYGTVPAVRGARSVRRKGGDRGADRAERRRQVDDAARDHGRRPSNAREMSGSPARRFAGGAPEQVVRAGIALVPEGRRIFAELTVEENLRLGLSGRQIARLEPTRRSSACTSSSRSSERRRRRQAGLLSGGQQQQLAIGRALVAEPGRAPARRAVARARADRRRHGLRGSASDQGAGRHDPARRATRTAHRRVRGSHLRHLERRAPDDARRRRTRATRVAWSRRTSACVSDRERQSRHSSTRSRSARSTR